MNTKKTHSHSNASSKSADSHAVQPSLSAPAPVMEAGAPATPAPVGAPSAAGTPFLSPPPATAVIPGVPANFVPLSGANYRSTGPKKAELTALPQAVTDLLKFTSYPQVIGATAPSYDDVLRLFEVTNQWSSMRTASTAWDQYSQVQEGLCWQAMRLTMARLKPAFDLAVAGNPSLLTSCAALASLLGAKRAIAKKAVSTKKANKKAIAEGKAPVHGGVGKKRQKQANKVLLAAAGGEVTATPVATTAPSAPSPVVVPAVGAPPATPVVSEGPASATPAAAPAVNGASPAAH